nr:hypothetical protein CFP56_02728 [Quercus suber]
MLRFVKYPISDWDHWLGQLSGSGGRADVSARWIATVSGSECHRLYPKVQCTSQTTTVTVQQSSVYYDEVYSK